MITSVDEEAGHADLPNLQANMIKKHLPEEAARYRGYLQDLEELAQLKKPGPRQQNAKGQILAERPWAKYANAGRK